MAKLNFEPRWFAVGMFFLAGIFLGSLGLFIWLFNGGIILDIQKIHPAGNSYKFINPLVAIDIERKEFLEDTSLRTKITAVIDSNLKKHVVDDIDVYYRDIEPGRWIGINERTNFSPGNILKVPIMIAYFKQAESDHNLLNTSLVLEGKPFTIEELIKKMITEDSNEAADLLYDNVDHNSLDEIYGDLGISPETPKDQSDFVTVKDYSLLFRILYNATYLDRKFSEKSLELLSQTDPEKGLASILPSNMVVAHKYGSRIMDDPKKLIEARDCGIFYYPHHPYLLCVVIRSQNNDASETILKQISTLVYQDTLAKY